MTSDEMVHLVQGQVGDYNRRNIDAFCKWYHPEIQVTMILSNQTTIRNIQEFREFYTKRFNEAPSLHCKILERTILPEAVVDIEFVTGVPQYPLGLQVVAIYGFRDGLIDRVWFPL